MSIERARAFRKQLTPPEARLWMTLRELRKRGLHFRRQAPFRGYYLDFVCFSRCLVVEVDGGAHDDQVQLRHDAVRDAVLSREGFRTLRFRNEDIRDHLDGVYATVVQALDDPGPTRSLRDHPPHKGEGERQR